MPTILISGAANGLGAAFLEAYQQDPNNTMIAIDRDSIVPKHDRIQTFQVDVSSQDLINEFAQNIRGVSVDVVIHSAGIRGLVPSIERERPDNVPACETMDVMDFDTLARAFQINAAGTFMLLRALIPNLLLSKHAKVIIMSSRMGSIGNNQHPNKAAGAAYAYRTSKAALNMIVRSFAADIPEISFILCHPGRVETKLVKCKEEGAIGAEESVADMLPLIERWDVSDSGKFYDRFGETIEW